MRWTPSSSPAAGAHATFCQALNATREAEQQERRRILGDLFWAGGDTVLVQPPFTKGAE